MSQPGALCLSCRTARRVVVHAEALRRLAEARENDYRRFLLLDCLEAYAALDGAQTHELEVLLRPERYREAKVMRMTSFEKGVEQGQRQGVEQGRRLMLQELLEARFGRLSPGVRAGLERLGADRLEALGLKLLTAQSLEELGLAG